MRALRNDEHQLKLSARNAYYFAITIFKSRSQLHESNKEARLEGRVKGKKMNKNNYGTHITAIQYLDIALLLRPSQFWSLLGQE